MLRVPNSYGGEGGIRTLDGLLTHTPLAGERLQPLGHLSTTGPLSHQPDLPASASFCCGALGGIRTPDTLVRSQVLYPTELPAHSRPRIIGAFGVRVKKCSQCSSDEHAKYTSPPCAGIRGLILPRRSYLPVLLRGALLSYAPLNSRLVTGLCWTGLQGYVGRGSAGRGNETHTIIGQGGINVYSPLSSSLGYRF